MDKQSFIELFKRISILHDQGKYEQIVSDIASAAQKGDSEYRLSTTSPADPSYIADALDAVALFFECEINFAYISELFFIFANAIHETMGDARVDPAAIEPLIVDRVRHSVSLDSALALFAALAVADPPVSESWVMHVLHAKETSLDDRIGLASCVAVIYQTLFKGANLPKGYSSLSARLRRTYGRARRQRMQFVADVASIASEQLSYRLRQITSDRPPRPARPPIVSMAVIVEDFGPLPRNTTTKLIVDWCYLLVRTFHNVHLTILVAKNHAPDDDFRMPGVHSCAIVGLGSLLEWYGLPTDADIQGRLTLRYVRDAEGGGFTERFVAELSRAAPDCTLFFSVPNFLIERAIYDHFPVVAIELLNGLNNSLSVDVMIPNGKVAPGTMELFGSKLTQVPYPQIPFVIRENYTRKSLNLPDPDRGVVIVSVGINFEQRIAAGNQLFWGRVQDILTQFPNAVWLMVGIGDAGKQSIMARFPDIAGIIMSGRLRFQQYELDLRALYGCCDIFALPPIAGGGRGTALAVSAGLPIVAYRFSDAANFVPPDQLHESHEGYFESLSKLIADESHRTDLGSKNKDIFSEDSLKYSAQGLLHGVFKAIETYNTRIAPAVLSGAA
jgi:hypothetical protein